MTREKQEPTERKIVAEQQRIEAFFSGQVQGVGFRYTTHTISRGYEVAGFVKNLSDGRVQLVAEGEPDQLQGFLSEIESRMSPYIRHTESTTQGATGQFVHFEITQ